MDILQRIQKVFTNFSQWGYAVSAIVLILTLCVLYYEMFRFLLENGMSVVIGVIVAVLIAFGFVFMFLDKIANVFYIFVPTTVILAFIFLYSSEIKHLIKFRRQKKHDQKTNRNFDEEEARNCISAIINALQNMSKKDIGAIIILSKGNVSSQILDSGTKINSDISSELIESVFFPKTPLHDGAMIIDGTKIVAAGCFLPLTQNENIPKDLGTRHRAGIGITETSDVIALIVSEETGIISTVYGGKLTRYADTDALKKILSKFYWQDLMKLK